MGSKKYDAKNEKSTFSLFFLYSLYMFLLLPLLLFYCYFRTIYFKLNGSFYTREGAEIC